MPVRGSMSTASWEKKPIASIGVLDSALLGSFGSTSNTKPWPAPPVKRVSSQVSQVPHGVPPPAQFVLVPEFVTKESARLRLGPTTTPVVPPIALGSYGLTAGTGFLPPSVRRSLTAVSSWLRTSNTEFFFGPGRATMPSKSAGTGAPLAGPLVSRSSMVSTTR